MCMGFRCSSMSFRAFSATSAFTDSGNLEFTLCGTLDHDPCPEAIEIFGSLSQEFGRNNDPSRGRPEFLPP